MKKLVYLLTLIASATLVAQGPDPRATALALAAPIAAASAASLGAGHTLVANDVFVDDIGQAHVRYQQTFQGVPVFEGEAIVHVDLATQSVLGTTDALLSFGTIDVRPGIGGENARGRASDLLNLPPGLASRSDLVIVVDGGLASLAWQVRAVGDDARGPVDRIALVEAHGGGVLKSWDNVETASAQGT